MAICPMPPPMMLSIPLVSTCADSKITPVSAPIASGATTGATPDGTDTGDDGATRRTGGGAVGTTGTYGVMNCMTARGSGSMSVAIKGVTMITASTNVCTTNESGTVYHLLLARPRGHTTS